MAFTAKNQSRVLVISSLHDANMEKHYFLRSEKRVVYQNSRGHYISYDGERRYVIPQKTTDYDGNPCDYMETHADKEKGRDTLKKLGIHCDINNAYK